MNPLPAALFVALLPLSVLAQMSAPRGGPPPEAFSACASRMEGDACNFLAPRGTVSGSCRTMREGRPVCVPDDAPGARRDGGRPNGMGGPADMGAPGNLGGAGGMGNPPGRGAQAAGGRAGPRPFGAAIAGDNPAAVDVKGKVPDTRQGSCFDDRGEMPCPPEGSRWFGQDGQYLGARPAYRDNGDGTVSDRVTGLTWEKAHHDTRQDWQGADAACRALSLGGRHDWRLPSIKELFSLADFRGSVGRRPYLDPVFEFRKPGTEVLEGDRFAASHNPDMMGQTWSSTIYRGVHYGRPGVEAAFFFNFLDGHIKQAPTRGRNRLFYRCVAGPAWGENRFRDLGKGMVRDEATELTWQQADDGQKRDWPSALAWCRALRLGGFDDWRLPNVKELESIVDYRRVVPALDERYLRMSDRKGWFWSSTTHGDNVTHAAYVCFGPCTDVEGLDVHGAGAQRSDPKTGQPSAYHGLGGQRDEVRIYNYVRCVR